MEKEMYVAMTSEERQDIHLGIKQIKSKLKQVSFKFFVNFTDLMAFALSRNVAENTQRSLLCRKNIENF